MKRLLLIITLSAAVLSATAASTDTTGMWDFNCPNGSEATITRWNGTGTMLEVPETVSAVVDGDEVSYTVVSLGLRSIRGAALEEVTLPSTLTNLEANVFASTTNLTRLVFRGIKPNFRNHWFGEIDLSKVTIYVYMDKFGWADDLAAGVMTQTVIIGDSSETITIPIKNCYENPAYTMSADPPPGLYSSSLQVSLSCDKTAQDGQRIIIFYTTDGTAPTLFSPQYAEPILVTAATTISCFAVLISVDTDHFLASGPIASFTYKFPLADGGPYTEKVSGRTWTFRVFGEKSYICPPSHATPCADPEPTGALVVPGELGGHPVAGLDVSAFERCLHLTEVEFPATVAKIGSFAFKDCLRLTNLVWKGTVPAIDRAAFDGCPLAGTGVTPTAPKTIYIPIEIQPDDTGAVSVPESWLDEMAVRHGSQWRANYVSRFGSDFTNSLLQATGKTDAFGNALCVWQDYVAGTDPLNASDVLTAWITVTNGLPYVSWSPDLSTATPARVYKVYGLKSLGPGMSPTDVTALTPAARKAAGHMFFYVTVQLSGN